MKKPSTIPDLTNIPEAELLKAVANILVQSGDVTASQQTELDAINAEFERRDRLTLV